MGPCAVYMKKMSSPTAPVAGGGWFKIWQDGVQNCAFCAQRLRDNNNQMTVKIPKDLAAYVARPAAHPPR